MVTRRTVLAGLAASSLVPMWASGASADVDVAVVGGGVAGSYTAWRLRKERPGLRVRLFEMSNRIGGRLRSQAFPQAPHLVGEVGGMRFLESHKHVFPLVKALNLPMRLYPVDDPHDRLDLRGRSFANSEAGEPTKLFPYNIPPADQSPRSGFFMRAVEKIVPGAKTMTPQQWMKVRSTIRYKGRLLKDWPAWALFSDVLTHEEMQFAVDASGYDEVFLHETALGDLDFNFLGQESGKFYTIAEGYQRLPLALAAEAERMGADVAMQTRLVSLSLPQSVGGMFRLAFQDASGRTSTLSATRLVLAMPRRALELIPDSPFARDPQAAALVASVEPYPACKALLLYPKPWWRALGIEGGRSVTDMPARQFYALGAETSRLPQENTNGYGVLMMYCDGRNVEYWKETVSPAKPADAGFQWLPANSELATEIHREAGLVYQTAPPRPLAACFQDWTADPYGGGWHFWAQGKDDYALADRAMQPLAGRELYICGEAYGFSPGWVEGALERAETMLQKHFALRPAPWLT